MPRSGRPIAAMADMSNSRVLGFTVQRGTDAACFEVSARLREGRVIPKDEAWELRPNLTIDKR